MVHKSIHDADALLLYRVGPVYCCSPTFPVESVMMPPHMTHPPGTTVAEPGVFKTPQGIVKAVDLRKRFGVDKEDWAAPGRIVIVEIEGGFAGIWVDEIIDVIQSPSKGWGSVPACIPKDVFSRTLLLNDVIQLYADFEKIYNFREVGYLRKHIENLKAVENKKILEEDKSLSQLSHKKDPVAPVNEIDKTEDSKLIQVSSLIDKQHESEALESKHNDVDKKIELNARESFSIESKKEILNKKIKSPEVGIVKSVDLIRDKSTSKDAVQNARNTDKNSKFMSGSSMADMNEKNRSSRLDSKVAKHESSFHSSSIVEGNSENDLHGSDEQSYSLYVIVSVAVIMMGVFVVNMMLPSIDDLVVPNEMGNSVSVLGKNEADKKILETNNVGAYKKRVDESLMQDEKEAYHADIKKDEEGLVIILSQAIEDGLLVEEKQSRSINSKALNVENSKAIKIIEGDIKDKVIDKSRDKLEKQRVIIHRVVKGDTLWHIARRYIHNPFRYPELAKLSHIKNPDLIYPGDMVKIIYKNDSK